EIISYVLEGALAHKDSMGNGSVLRYGDVQVMSAGTGVVHSEFNGSTTEGVHFLQIWIEPNEIGAAPRYEEKHFDTASKTGKLRVVASNDGRDGSVSIRQDASIQICRKCTPSVFEPLNSLCTTPVPALMTCTSP
ncbi:MAG: pirin family protein, partial [Oxalobacteraceae bacterium]